MSTTDARVLLVANYESDVGYAWWLMENFWHEIAAQAAARGLECILAYPRIRSVPEIIRRSPVRIVEFSVTRGSLAHVLRGVRFMRRNGVRSVYLSDWPHRHWIYALWRLAGIRRIVLHLHSGGEAPTASGLSRLRKQVIQAVGMFSATQYVAPSEYMGRRLLESGRVPARRCAVVTNGIRPFDCDPARRAGVREMLGIPEDAVVTALVSRATYHKGVQFAVRCFARLLEDSLLRGRVFAVHCGDGPELATFTAMAESAGIGPWFRFLGYRHDVRDILCASDIALHPSRTEAMSLAILEFLSAGLAVVTPDLRSVSTAIEPGVTGVTYRSEDLDDAVRVLRGLIADPAERRRLGAAASAACRRLYSLDAMNRSFRDKVLPVLLPKAIRGSGRSQAVEPQSPSEP